LNEGGRSGLAGEHEVQVRGGDRARRGLRCMYMRDCMYMRRDMYMHVDMLRGAAGRRETA
jgi:hypothetical protein